MTAAQARAARELLEWSTERLAARCGFPSSVLQRFERLGIIQQARGTQGRVDRSIVLRSFLEAAGVVFTDGEEPGVKLRKVEG